MFLHKLLPNILCQEVRRDLANPYELHSTLCRAFAPPEKKCSGGTFLWRLESLKSDKCNPQILVQSAISPDWSRIGVKDWFNSTPKDPVDLFSQLSLSDLQVGQSFRFRLRANPSVCRLGKRKGLIQNSDQIKWLVNKGLTSGFKLSQLSSFSMEKTEDFDFRITQEQMLRGQQRSGHEICIYSVQYDGILSVTDVEKFVLTLKNGIGRGKVMGLGLLSVVPIW